MGATGPKLPPPWRCLGNVEGCGTPPKRVKGCLRKNKGAQTKSTKRGQGRLYTGGRHGKGPHVRKNNEVGELG